MKSLCLILILALNLSACARFSQSARRQRAYERYVQKSMGARARQQAKFTRSRAPKMPITAQTDPGAVTQTTTDDGPQAVPRDEASQ
jgi:hypothetical protein